MRTAAEEKAGSARNRLSRKRGLAHMDRAGGDARGRMLRQGETDRGHPSGHCGRVDCLSVSADGVFSDCAGRGDGGGGTAAASIKEGKRMSVRMVCIKAPRFLRALIRLFAGTGK